MEDSKATVSNLRAATTPALVPQPVAILPLAALIRDRLPLAALAATVLRLAARSPANSRVVTSSKALATATARLDIRRLGSLVSIRL